MLGWTIFFFVFALVAAAFGFGAIASAFSGIALVLFWIFVALAVLSLLFGAFRTRHGHSVARGGRTLGLVAVAAVIGAVVYAWVDNDWSAEQAGRSIDENAAQIAENVGEGVEDASVRTGEFFEATGESLREDASDALGSAERNVSPDESDDRPEDNQN